MSVPKLRFKEFEGDWIETTLGEVASISSGGTPSRSNSEYWNGNIPWITTSLIGENIISTADEYITEAGLKNSAAKIFPHGTLLMAMYGQGKTRGKIGLLGIDAATNQACAAIIFKLNFSNIFFLQILRNKYIEIRNMSNVGGQDNLSASLIKQISIVYPTPSEQTKIANFLTTIDDYINQLTRKHALFTQYKKAAMQQIFSQQLRFKDENGEDFADWEERSFSEFGDIVTGKTPSTSDSSYWNGEIMFVTPTDMNGSKYQNDSQRTLKLQPKMRFLPKDSIMFTCIASIGKMSISTAPTVTNQQINSIVPNGKFNSDFLYYAIFYMSDFIKSTKSSSTLPIINKTEFSKFNILIPSSKNEQTKIANFLTQLDQQLDQLQQQIDHIKQYKQGLLQQMFV